MRPALLMCALFAAAGCASKEVPHVRGRTLLSAPAKELWVAPGGLTVATLTEASASGERGAPPDVLLGALTVVPVSGGAPRRVGGAVSNLPGSIAFSRDGQYLAFVAGYSIANANGELRLARLSGGEPEVLGTGVTFFAFSPAGDLVAWVSDGDLSVRPVAGGPVRRVATGVSLAQFGPAGTPAEGRLLVKRSVRVDGALLSYELASGKLTALARGVGAFGWSPGGDALAFHADALLAPAAVEPASRFARQGEDDSGLYLQLGLGRPRRVHAEGASEFKFSPKGRRLAFVTPPASGASTGDLYVVDGAGVPTKVAPRVAQFVFAQDGSLALLGAYDRSASAGTLGVFPPEGALVEVARSVRQFSVTPQGRFVLFLHGVVRNTTYSLGLAVYRLGAPQGEKFRDIDHGVTGYLVDAAEKRLAYKARCIDEGKSCSLFVADLQTPGPPTMLVSRVTAFEFAPDAEQLVVAASRPAAKLSGKLLFGLGTVPTSLPPGAKWAQVALLDETVTGEFALAGADGRQVVYLVDEQGREGVGVVPLGAGVRPAAAP